MLTACSKAPDSVADSDSFGQIAQATEKAQTYLDAREYTQAFNKLKGALNTLPKDTITNDSVVKYARYAISQCKAVALKSKEYLPVIHYLDSLQSPFFRKYCHYELLAIRAHLYQMCGENTRAIAIIDSFAALPNPPEAERLIQYSELAGSVYFYCGHDLQTSITQLEKAVQAYRQGGESPYIGRILSRLGAHYREKSNYEKAVQVNQEAITFYETKQKKDNGSIMAYGEQSNLYMALDMFDKALALNHIACTYSIQQDSFGLSDLYRFRGDIYQKTGKLDSAFYYYDHANEVSKAQGSFKGAFYNQLCLAQAYLTQSADSASHVLKIAEQLCADSAKVPQWLNLQLKECMGQALVHKGHSDTGIRLMEQACTGFRNMGLTDIYTNTMQTLMNAYLQTGMKDRFTANYPIYKTLLDSTASDEKIRALAAANIRFETQKKAHQNQILRTEVALKNSRLQLYAFLGTALLIIGICVGGWLWMRQRALKLHLYLRDKEKQLAEIRLLEQSERMQQLITSRQELNNHNEDLLRQLEEIQSANERTCDLDRVMESLRPRLLTTEEEEQFRTTFSNLYPSALHRLREACPRATRADELLCMLIILKQTNEEIARTLGISRPSVLQNRYRLRTKLNLPEGCDLDAEVRQLLN